MGNFAVSDLHGCLGIWRQIQSFCKDSDRIFVLGDCVDRGREPLNTLKAVLGDSRVTMLKGNHEQMFQDVIEEERDFGLSREHWDIWIQNGGAGTYTAWQQEGCNYDWISTLKHLPYQTTYINPDGMKFLMSHSGTVPEIIRESDGRPFCSGHRCLWDRKHIGENYDGEWICVGGHTPIVLTLPRDAEWPGGALWYCDDRKVNLDNGTYATGISCLLDLDTLDEHIFEVK